MPGPLDGYQILDLTSVIMGPFATQTLGDMGADVIKIESPNGDVTRQIGPARNVGMSALYLNVNRNKRSLVLNLKKKKGREILLRLSKSADVVIHSMRPKAMARLGLTYADFQITKPDIIYCGCYGFGKEGPYADRPAYDDVIQGVSALSSIMGFNTSEPKHVPALLADKTTGMAATQAISFALLHRERTGEGQSIEVPMFENMVHFNLIEHFFGAKFDPPKSEFGYTRILATERKPMKTLDGYISLMPYNNKHWQAFFAAFDRNDMLYDQRVTDATYRAEHISELYIIASDLVRRCTSDEVIKRLVSADVPCMPVNNLSDLLDDPHIRATNFIFEENHPTEGKLKSTAIPTHFSKSPGSIKRHAPVLGEHSVEVLSEGGFSRDEIDSFAESGITKIG
ncbi:MAG: CoA transferase [Pseudomonadota bacterium]|nr:CoA transferase [Pseudomonadota bacterium]